MRRWVCSVNSRHKRRRGKPSLPGQLYLLRYLLKAAVFSVALLQAAIKMVTVIERIVEFTLCMVCGIGMLLGTGFCCTLSCCCVTHLYARILMQQ